MFCKKCGAEIVNVNAKFCTKCGNKLNDDQPSISVHNGTEDIKIHKMQEVVIEKKTDIVEEEKPDIPSKEYSPLEQALNNMQNRQKKCPNCGMMVLNEARFCFNCGKKI